MLHHLGLYFVAIIFAASWIWRLFRVTRRMARRRALRSRGGYGNTGIGNSPYYGNGQSYDVGQGGMGQQDMTGGHQHSQDSGFGSSSGGHQGGGWGGFGGLGGGGDGGGHGGHIGGGGGGDGGGGGGGGGGGHH